MGGPWFGGKFAMRYLAIPQSSGQPLQALGLGEQDAPQAPLHLSFRDYLRKSRDYQRASGDPEVRMATQFKDPLRNNSPPK